MEALRTKLRYLEMKLHRNVLELAAVANQVIPQELEWLHLIDWIDEVNEQRLWVLLIHYLIVTRHQREVFFVLRDAH